MSDLTPIVSYIVPIYNAERFLRKTLDALSAQTYEDVEFILVDDGSTDGSAAVCDEYCAKDSRFKCLHTANGGVSRARNAGIEKAAGEYVMFCDADDIPHPDIVKTLVEKCRGDDIVLCGFRRVGGKEIREETFSAETVYTQKSDIMRNLIMPMCVWNYTPDGQKIQPVYGSVWRGLYSKKLFSLGGTRFDSEIGLGEDMLANVGLLHGASSVRLITEVLYDYIENPQSVTHSEADKLWNKYLKLWNKTLCVLRPLHSPDDTEWYYYQLTRYAVSAVVEGICRAEMPFAQKKRAVKKILSHPDMKKAIAASPSGIPSKDRLLLKMLRPAFASEVLMYYSKKG